VLRRFGILLLFFGGLLTLFHCRPERFYIEEADAKLAFSLDTVYFDTVFTTVGTTTRNFRIYNPHDRFIKIDRITLAGGDNSVFRVNVDGAAGTAFENFEIAPNDSMYVFVEATLDPNESPDILRIQDSITFSVNGNLQDIDLVAWGQDVHMLKGDSISIDVSTNWTSDKPYLIIGNIWVQPDVILAIEEGVEIYMHRDASMFFYGSLQINGTIESPVIIQGDRLEADYADVPGQWGWIVFPVGSKENSIQHAKIINGTIGLFVNSPLESDQPVLQISNTEINQMAYAGIIGQGSSISASNLVIGDCGNTCLALIYEGSYEFTHCTFANYWHPWLSNRQTPALTIANYVIGSNNEVIPGNIYQADFNNCIIYGDRKHEIVIDRITSRVLDYHFDHCLTKIDTSEFDYTVDPKFTSIYNNEDPLFDSLRVSYELDSLSAAIDRGRLEYAIEYGFDKKGNSRVGDGKPDLGAFEKIFE